MTDKYTELFLFCYISYIYINISTLKCLQIRFLIFFTSSEWLSEWRVGTLEMVQEGINAFRL